MTTTYTPVTKNSASYSTTSSSNTSYSSAAKASTSYSPDSKNTAVYTATTASSSTILIDSYDETNRNSTIFMDVTGVTRAGQTFLNPSSITLDSCKFYLTRNGSITGNATVKIYAMTGTSGTNGLPTGSALATSDALDVSTITPFATFTLYTFTFSGANRITLATNTNYCIEINYSSTASLGVGRDSSSPTHAGNYFQFISAAYAASSLLDLCFYVYGLTAYIPVIKN